MGQILNDSISFQWHITDICNLRCKHCYQENFSPDKDLDLHGIKEIIQNLSLQFKNMYINITGGEPFLKDDFFEVLDIISLSKNTKEFSIITNGTLINEELVKKLKKYKKLKELKISIDGIKLNEYIRGKGLLKVVEKNLKKIEGIKKIIMFTALKHNYSEIEDILKFSNEIADGLIIERFIPLGTGMNLYDSYLNNYEWRFIVDTIKRIYLLGDINELAKFRAFYIDFNKEKIYGALCNLGESFAIMPDGTIYPCRRLPVVLGNAVNEKNIKNKIKEFRRNIEENLVGKCRNCKYFNECIGCRASVYALRKDLFYPDEQCFL